MRYNGQNNVMTMYNGSKTTEYIRQQNISGKTNVTDKILYVNVLRLDIYISEILI